MNKWYMHNPAAVLENDTHKVLWDFDIQTDHLISARRPDLIVINEKKRTCKIVDLIIVDRIKLKESEKKDKYLDLARELKKLWNMKVTIIPIMIGAFGTVTKVLLKGLEDLEVGGQVETIQTTALLRTARILSRVLETCCHSSSSKIERKQKEGYIPRHCKRIEKTVEHESNDYTNCNWCSCYSHQRIDTRTGGLRNKRTSGNHPNYTIIKISQNTEKSPGDLRLTAFKLQ